MTAAKKRADDVVSPGLLLSGQAGALIGDLRVHFLNRNHLLGGVSVQRHRGGKAAVQEWCP
ncbi:hypothetical protein LNO81_03535 [Klebsiella variicola subsp. variicola]|nr:hypothetical protein [Klebsiella variicola subsp. variicola]